MRYKTIAEQLDMKPVVDVVPYNVDYSRQLQASVTDKELIFEYPTVYLIYDRAASRRGSKAPQFKVYVGETSDIERRTRQHLEDDPKKRTDWLALSKSEHAQMMVIGDYYFNKSLTLDIENRLMMYLLSVESISQLNNRRANPQRKYFMSDRFDAIFDGIWYALRMKRPDMFPEQREVENSAIFKASPFHSLNAEQNESKLKIFDKVETALTERKAKALTGDATVIFIAGQAGTGKTVLLSNLFYDLTGSKLVSPGSVYLLVNHEQQVKVYKAIAHKLGLDKDQADIVSRPTHFINSRRGKPRVDVVLVDEAHLLWTQGKQSYRGNNQLDDLLKLAKVVIIVFDKYQILTTEEYLDDKTVRRLEDGAAARGNRIELLDQERMDANRETINWIRSLVIGGTVATIPDDESYQLKVAQSPEGLYEKIKLLDQQNDHGNASLSRMLATFDWPYVDKKKPADDDYWRVKVGHWSLPWNLQLKVSKQETKRNKELAWAEQAQTINEVGSTFTIQGFDLNYAGVIIGPAVKYRDGKIIFDPKASKNKKATNKRTWKGQKINVANELLRNELNVLLTRGVHGLFIYAVDAALQAELLKAAGTTHILEDNNGLSRD
ncbi:DUF2075 domain-containing protein [Lactiplantibacillus garii]|uniref:DUF2075 domain-containing protein n=1 Tax=Lactiplantibacillus garii TaxID=2306423 RepID=A0A3R8J4R9_9LACO|nr:DUF2075 domain-containing protein [Lactiplantibacillus garii]RRK09244.1 DUF2075 domain-containing protein [Lactiplantibacillus garii]